MKFLLAILLTTGTSVFAAEHVIEMKSMEFSPRSLSIQVGDQIVWKNVSLTDHTATSVGQKNSWTTGAVPPKTQSKPILFEKTGKFKYFCEVHGKKSMNATINVKSSKRKN